MKTVDRITKLLEFLSEYRDGIGINEISESIDLPLSTTHRMLSALKKNDYVCQDKLTKRYKLGIRILSLATNMINNMDIVKIARPIIEDLSIKYGQLVFLSVLENNRVICVDMVNYSKIMKFYVRIGSNMPVHCASASKVIVANLEESRINDILKSEDIKKYTTNTKVEIDEIKKELSMIRQQGYAECKEELELGVNAFAIPIYGRDNEVYASITIMIMNHLEYDREQIINDLKYSGNKISEYLGYSG